MQARKADRIKIKVGNMWESPTLHVLLTEEDDVIVARCLDFTVSSHGEDEKKALEALGEAIREYILTAVEENAIENVLDPAHGKYWRMYNELESKQVRKGLKKSLRKVFESGSTADQANLSTEIHYV